MKKDIDIYCARDENILFYLTRYALPRNTSCVPEVISFIKEHKNWLRDTEKAKLIREIEKSMERGECDKNKCYSQEFLELIKELNN